MNSPHSLQVSIRFFGYSVKELMLFANDSFSNFESCLVSKSQDCQSKHRGRDWRLMSNLQLRISSLSLRAPWTYKKLWTHSVHIFCVSKNITFCSDNIYMLKCSYMIIFFKILFITSSHTFQTFWSAVCCIAWIGSA